MRLTYMRLKRKLPSLLEEVKFERGIKEKNKYLVVYIDTTTEELRVWEDFTGKVLYEKSIEEVKRRILFEIIKEVK